MPAQQKLKVYRTPIGFHDAFVAASSQKSALKAWGSDSDLFAQKIAEQVTDPELITEPLSRPGEIIRKLRGTAHEQLEALGSLGVKKAAKRREKSKPRPSRASLAKIEREVQALERRQAGEVKALKSELAALEQRLQKAELAHAVELKVAEGRLQDERDRYDRALRLWKDS